MDPYSTYIFTDAGAFDITLDGILWNNSRVVISFVAPTSGQILILRLKHAGEENGPLEVTLVGSTTTVQFNPSYESSLTIDDVTLYPIQIPGPSKSDHLSFKPGIRNVIVMHYRETIKRHFLHDIELLDESGLEWKMREL